MKISELHSKEISRLLQREGLRIQIGPFVVSLNSSMQRIAENIALFYADYTLPDRGSFVDFHVRIDRPPGLRRWYRPQAVFYFDQLNPFKPLPADQAFAMFEWGLNWCIATIAHQFLIVHAAVVAKEDKALLLPGEPGAGKSTLCAALVSRGWRLLSDEMALINPHNLQITPVPRPIGLKNASIDIMQRFDARAVIGPRVADTVKGTVAHLRPPDDSIRRADTDARPVGIVFPLYSTGSATRLEAVSRGKALLRIVEQSFNYHILEADAFAALERLISATPVFDLRYSQLDSVIADIDALLDDGVR